MPRNVMTKDEVKCRVMKLKNDLYNGMHNKTVTGMMGPTTP